MSETTPLAQVAVTWKQMQKWVEMEGELARLRAFVQWVADHSNDPGIVAEARKMGAG
jgi:hypothetical protein